MKMETIQSSEYKRLGSVFSIIHETCLYTMHHNFAKIITRDRDVSYALVYYLN